MNRPFIQMYRKLPFRLSSSKSAVGESRHLSHKPSSQNGKCVTNIPQILHSLSRERKITSPEEWHSYGIFKYLDPVKLLLNFPDRTTKTEFERLTDSCCWQ